MTTRLAGAAGAIALVAALSIPFTVAVSPTPALAEECQTDDPGVDGAESTGTDAFACGPNSDANGDNTTAIGEDANAGGEVGSDTLTPEATAVGADSDVAPGANGGTAVGYNADVNGSGSDGAVAVGRNSESTGLDAIAVGDNAEADGTNAIAIGGDGDDGNDDAARALATDAIAIGADSLADAEDAIAIGQDSTATGGEYAMAIGGDSVASAEDAIAIGGRASADSEDSIAIGGDSVASAEDTVAIGGDSLASAGGAIAIGEDAKARFTDSAAFGRGATTTLAHQQVFGTSDETYVMPGITSGLSKSRQSGPLEVVTTDGMGNLASDGGALYDGVAIAMATENPDLKGDENFGLALNLSNFNGQATALGASFIGTVFKNATNRFAVSGAFGVGFNAGTVGGRVSGQLTW